jgi:hypothetical protein
VLGRRLLADSELDSRGLLVESLSDGLQVVGLGELIVILE